MESFMTDVYTAIQKSIEAIPEKKLHIISSSTFYSNNGISGLKFSIEYKQVIYPLFAGFSNESKYSNKLIFGVLKCDRTKGLNFLEYDKDENDNLIQDTLKINDNFFKLNEAAQIKKLSKWLYEESKAFAIGNSLFNHKSKETKNTITQGNSSEISPNKKVESEEINIDYSNLTTSQWFKIVELPWLIIILSFIPGIYASYIPELNIKANYALLTVESLLFFIGLILIFLTINKKKQIRKALKLPLTKDPFTWFISRIGKVVCGTQLFCLMLPIIIVLDFFKADVTTNSSSSSSSSNSRKYSYDFKSEGASSDYKPSSEHRTSYRPSSNEKSPPSTSKSSSFSSNNSKTSTTNNTSKSRTNSTAIKYYCIYCGYSSSSISSLTSSSCVRHPDGQNKGRHLPYEGSIRSKYECEYCGYSSSSIATLTSSTCVRHPNGQNKGRHKPYIGEPKSRYICKYCGYSSSSIATLTSSPCVRHPNGQNKGRHSPQI